MQATAATRRRNKRAPGTAARIVGWALIALAALIPVVALFSAPPEDPQSASSPALSAPVAIVFSSMWALWCWLSWALGRSLSPDEPWAGVLAIVLGNLSGGLFIANYELPVIPGSILDFIAGYLLLIMIGLLLLLLVGQVRRAGGPAVRWRRLSAITVLTVICAAGLAGWPIGLAVALAFVLDARLSTGLRARASLGFGVAALLATAAAAAGASNVWATLGETAAISIEDAVPIAAWLGVLAVVGAGAALVLRQRPVAAMIVRRGTAEPIDQDRARAALLIALVFVAGPLLSGWPGLVQALPVAGIVTAVAICRALPFGRVRAAPA